MAIKTLVQMFVFIADTIIPCVITYNNNKQALIFILIVLLLSNTNPIKSQLYLRRIHKMSKPAACLRHVHNNMSRHVTGSGDGQRLNYVI